MRAGPIDKVALDKYITREEPTEWFSEDDMDLGRIEDLIIDLLLEIGEDPKREGLRDTPARVARFWKEFIDYDPGNIGTTFEATEVDQMIVVKDIPFWSLCEHHLLPFSGLISVGYLTHNRVIGLSKIPRIVQKHAHKLQLQERLTRDVAQEIYDLLEPDIRGVGVQAKANHTCMEMRGIKSPGEMVTCSLLGEFRDIEEVKQEFLSTIAR